MPDIIQLATDYGWFANLLQIATFFGLPSLSAIVAYLWRQRSLEKQSQQKLADAVAALSKELERTKLALADARARDPHNWMRSFSNLEDRVAAATFLAARLNESSPALHDSFAALAAYVEAAYRQHGGDLIFEAQRLAHISRLIDQNSKESKELCETLDAEIELQQLQRRKFDPYSPDLVPEVQSLSPEVATLYIKQLLGLAIKVIHAGKPALYEVITRRARAIGIRHLPPDDDLLLNARQLWAESLVVNSLPHQAMDEVKAILPAMQASLDPSDQRLKEVLLLEGQLAMALGDSSALERIMKAAQAFPDLRAIFAPYQGRPFKPVELTEEEKQAALDAMIKAGATPIDQSKDK